MAMELGGEKVACDMAKASLATPAIQGAQHYVEGGPKAGPPWGFVAGKGKTVRKRLGGKADFSYWQC